MLLLMNFSDHPRPNRQKFSHFWMILKAVAKVRYQYSKGARRYLWKEAEAELHGFRYYFD